MKITGRPSTPANIPVSLPPKSPEPTSQLEDLPKSPKPHRRRRTRLRRTAAPAEKRGSRPETPLLKWKIEERVKNSVSVEDGEEFRRRGRQRENPISARKLASVLWRFSLPEIVGEVSGVVGRGEDDEAEPSFKFFNSSMEGATKWDPVTLKGPGEVDSIHVDRKVNVSSSLEAELEQVRARIQELDSEQRHSKKKLEHSLKKLSEEKAAWRRREHEKIRAFIDDIKSELNRERKSRQRLSIINSKLVDDVSEAKLSAKRILDECEKERKTRKLIEKVCNELAKEMGEDKGEVEEIKKESIKLRDEVEEERRMLEIAEVWLEERAQMKLVDAKVALEEKYSQMKKLVADLENFLLLRSKNANPDLLEEAEVLIQTAASINIQEITDFFHYEPPDNDILSALEGEMSNCGEMEGCGSVSSTEEAEKRVVAPMKHNCNRSEEEDESSWETVGNLGSSFSPASNSSSGKRNKSSLIARLWRSMEDGVMMSPDGGNPHMHRNNSLKMTKLRHVHEHKMY